MKKNEKNGTIEITKLSKLLDECVDEVVSNRLEKITILDKNQPQAVMISSEKYEYLKAILDQYEDLKIKKDE